MHEAVASPVFFNSNQEYKTCGSIRCIRRQLMDIKPRGEVDPTMGLSMPLSTETVLPHCREK
jgi:hypothetical protein